MGGFGARDTIGWQRSGCCGWWGAPGGEGVAMALPCPHRCVPSDARRKTRAFEPALDEVALGALLEIQQCLSPSPASNALVGRAHSFVRDPVVVIDSNRFGQPAQVSRIDGREMTANRNGPWLDSSCEVEGAQPIDGAPKRGIGAGANAQPESVARRGGVEPEPVGFLVEAVGEVAQQDHACRPQRGQPEGLDVSATRIVADRREDRVGPRSDSKVAARRCDLGHGEIVTDHVKLCQVVVRRLQLAIWAGSNPLCRL